jgi:NADH:ubiquinone oxidoreductase subunit 6 (subunit J)
MKKKTIEIMGWYGAAAIVGAYALTSFGILTSSNIWYQLINLTGALGIAVISFSKKAYQPAVLNILWIIIAIIALVRMVLI